MNQLGEDAATAMAACQKRCQTSGMRCNAINVVPIVNPHAVAFPDDRNYPYDFTGFKFSVGADCKSECFAREPPGSQVCYGLTSTNAREVEAKWDIVADDPTDATFYSTCYFRGNLRTFDGPQPSSERWLTQACRQYWSG